MAGTAGNIVCCRVSGSFLLAILWHHAEYGQEKAQGSARMDTSFIFHFASVDLDYLTTCRRQKELKGKIFFYDHGLNGLNGFFIVLRFFKKTIITHFISQNEKPGPTVLKNRYAAAGDFYEHGLNGLNGLNGFLGYLQTAVYYQPKPAKPFLSG